MKNHENIKMSEIQLCQKQSQTEKHLLFQAEKHIQKRATSFIASASYGNFIFQQLSLSLFLSLALRDISLRILRAVVRNSSQRDSPRAGIKFYLREEEKKNTSK